MNTLLIIKEKTQFPSWAIVGFLLLILLTASFSLRAQDKIPPAPSIYYNLDMSEVVGGNKYVSTIHSKGNSALLPKSQIGYGSIAVRYNFTTDPCLQLTESSPSYMFTLNEKAGTYLYGLATEIKSKPISYTLAGWFYFSDKVSGSDPTYPDPKSILGNFHINGNTNFPITSGLVVGNSKLQLRNRVDFKDQNGNYGFADMQLDFDDLTQGWYFIAISQSQYNTRVYLGSKSSNNFVCTSKPIGWQYDYDAYGNWTLGTLEPNANFLAAADDLMIWDKALTSDQVLSLFNCSKDKNPMTGNCWQTMGGATVAKATTAVKALRIEEKNEEKNPEAEKISIYPNPTNGPLQLEVNLLEESPVEIGIFEINGSLIYNHTLQLPVGATKVELDLSTSSNAKCNCIGISPQMIIVKVKTRKMESVQKIVLQ